MAQASSCVSVKNPISVRLDQWSAGVTIIIMMIIIVTIIVIIIIIIIITITLPIAIR